MTFTLLWAWLLLAHGPNPPDYEETCEEACEHVRCECWSTCDRLEQFGAYQPCKQSCDKNSKECKTRCNPI